MAKIRLSSELRQKQILDVTLQIISESGIAGVNTSEIAKRVGIVPSALYRHFENKEALIDALLDRTHQTLTENVRKIALKFPSSIENLRRIFLMHLELIMRYPGIPKLVFSDATVLGSPERKEQIFSIVKTYSKQLTSIVEKGQHEKEILSTVLPEAVVFSMISFVQHTALISNITDGETDLSKSAAIAWNYIEKSIRNNQHNK